MITSQNSVQYRAAILLTALIAMLYGCNQSANYSLDTGRKTEVNNQQTFIQDLLAGYDQEMEYPAIMISYPYPDAIFPPEIAAPVIIWEDSNGLSSSWLIQITFNNGSNPVHIISYGDKWEPDKESWENIKDNTAGTKARITILGIGESSKKNIVSRGEVEIGVAPVGVEAAILFRQVPLPFPVKNIERVKWRLGDIASYNAPSVILDGLPVCSSCHTVSQDGKYLSMEMNYGNDSGAQFIAPIQKNMVLSKNDFISWNDYPRQGILPKTRGLFGRMSPTGDYVVATVNELSLALLTNDYRFSQVFFPTYGILAHYSVAEKKFRPLPGADDYDYVQANPDWSPDEQHIVFARALTKNQVHDDITDVSPKKKDEDIYALNKRYNIQFDLYRIPFNNGLGGTPVPLVGASSNNMSNYFPRHSPDGKWIVFTQSKTGIMLQPDSQLYIVPAIGGTARRMQCNRELFNSWHSWSPNSRWLLFSSKVNTPFTEIFLTYVDEKGNDHPPVLLSRFSDPDYAANVPEFVNIEPTAIEKIIVQ